MIPRYSSFVLCLVGSSLLTFAQVAIQCPVGGPCTAPNIPQFASGSTIVNSNLKQAANGSITDSAGLAVAGPGPWIDVTAPGINAVASCPAPFTAATTGCTDQTSNIQTAISKCATFSSSANPSGCTIFFPMGTGAYYIQSSLILQRSGPAALNGVKLVGECNAPGSGILTGGAFTIGPLNCTSIVTDQSNVDMPRRSSPQSIRLRP